MNPENGPSLRFADLWRWSGTVDRGLYAVIGVVLFVIKYGLDRTVSVYGFGRPWSPLDYLNLPNVGAITALGRDDLIYCAAMVAVALPFIWMGTALSAKRLRAARLPVWLVVFFFAPLLNVLFFAILSVLPTRMAAALERPEGSPSGLRGFFDRVIPRSRFGNAAVALVLTLPAFLLGSVLSIEFFASYGWSLFVGMPFALGLVAAMLYGYHAERSLAGCVTVACLAVGLLAGGLMIFAMEGAICLLMAAPLGFGLAALGGMVGHVLQKRPASGGEATKVMAAVWLVLPLVFGLEQIHEPTPPLIPVRTMIEIDAPSETVWRHVVSFSELPSPEDWLFRTGIAYPMRARIEGEGVGAVRHCEFSTGAFVEPITVWEAPHRLAFSVYAQPHPMQEWTFFKDLDPAHLDGYFGSERGQFLLTPLPGGRTLLEGATWYRHRIWPNAYWQQWSDWALHRIHRRVLRHVKRLAEADTA